MISDLSRASATRLTLLTQAVALALGAGAVALVVIGLPERAIPQPKAVGTPPGMPPADGSGQPSQSQTTPVAFQPVDMGGLAERLGMIANAPAEPETTTIEEPDNGTDAKGTDNTEPPQPFASRVRYLGLITIGGSNAAFVSIDNRQRIVKEGDVVAAPTERPELGDLTIVKIEAAKVTVAHDDGDAEISLAERQNSGLTMVEADPADPGPAETAQPVLDARFENNGAGERRPQEQIDRRRRALERQRNSDPRDYDGPGLVMPEIRRVGNIGNRRRGGNERPEQDEPRDD